VEILFCSYECVYGLEAHREDPNHMGSIKRGYVAHFSIKRLHTQLDVVEITFYHWIHTPGNGDLAHGACDLGSTSQMLAYVPCVSHKLKEFIWTQLGLGYTMKQIYDKHKKIWWEQTNASEWMTQDDFL
jgi:quinolinate synthase